MSGGIRKTAKASSRFLDLLLPLFIWRIQRSLYPLCEVIALKKRSATHGISRCRGKGKQNLQRKYNSVGSNRMLQQGARMRWAILIKAMSSGTKRVNRKSFLITENECDERCKQNGVISYFRCVRLVSPRFMVAISRTDRDTEMRFGTHSTGSRGFNSSRRWSCLDAYNRIDRILLSSSVASTMRRTKYKDQARLKLKPQVSTEKCVKPKFSAFIYSRQSSMTREETPVLLE